MKVISKYIYIKSKKMQAEKLKKKKYSISKGKLKKTIKNVICRPDPVFWPVVNEDEEKILQHALSKHRVSIPEFNKPHWNDIKLLPKKDRPRPPQIQRVAGLLFGISECCDAVQSQNCTAVLLEANINPQAIVHCILEMCISFNISVLCIKDLKLLSRANFGIKTSCLGIKRNYLHQLTNEIQNIYQKYKPEKKNVSVDVTCPETKIVSNVNKDSPMDADTYCPYVYRNDKKSRAFIPTNTQEVKSSNQFTGQNFIKMSSESKPDNNTNTYMRMILKKISNNPNRVKVKQKK